MTEIIYLFIIVGAISIGAAIWFTRSLAKRRRIEAEEAQERVRKVAEDLVWQRRVETKVAQIKNQKPHPSSPEYRASVATRSVPTPMDPYNPTLDPLNPMSPLYPAHVDSTPRFDVETHRIDPSPSYSAPDPSPSHDSGSSYGGDSYGGGSSYDSGSSGGYDGGSSGGGGGDF